MFDPAGLRAPERGMAVAARDSLLAQIAHAKNVLSKEVG